MVDLFFSFLAFVDNLFWEYIGFTVVFLLGGYLTYRSQFFQLFVLFRPSKVITNLHRDSQGKDPGVNPFKLFFASVGGMIGLGNVVAVVTALLIGGPGSLVWLWMASIIGMVIKYSEIYLGVTFRVEALKEGTFFGGPIYYLKHAFQHKVLKILIPGTVALLLCIYGVEVYQFAVIVDTFSRHFQVDRLFVIISLLVCTLITGLGGVRRLANVSTSLMPLFMILYCVMTLIYIGSHSQEIPGVLLTVLKSAFTGHAALGGFAGSGVLLSVQQGIARAVYSGDIAIGYDSIIQSETRSKHPHQQAQLGILGMLLDTLICTLTILVVLISGLWYRDTQLLPSQFIPTALSEIFPYMDYFMTMFVFLAGWTTINSYFVVGLRCASFLSNKWGTMLYTFYAIIAFILFSYSDQTKVLLIMSLSGGLLMAINLVGIVKLRKHIKFVR